MAVVFPPGPAARFLASRQVVTSAERRGSGGSGGLRLGPAQRRKRRPVVGFLGICLSLGPEALSLEFEPKRILYGKPKGQVLLATCRGA